MLTHGLELVFLGDGGPRNRAGRHSVRRSGRRIHRLERLYGQARDTLGLTPGASAVALNADSPIDDEAVFAAPTRGQP